MFKKLTVLAVAVVLLAALMVSAQTWTTGIGDGLTATLADGTFTVSGSGQMEDYGSMVGPPPPWFESRNSITAVVIGDGVTRVGAGFHLCDNLTTISIGSGAISVFTQGFPSSLAAINVSADNANFSSVDGVLFNKVRDTLIKYPMGKPGASYTIPDGVTSVGAAAFIDCAGLTSITIPNSMTSVGANAFNNCSGLTSINVAAENTAYRSVDGVLFNKAQDALIQYPIGKPGASYTIPDGVTSVGNNAFYNCVILTSVTIPGSVVTLGNAAFGGCVNLSSVTSFNPVPPAVGNTTFLALPNDAILYVPEESIDAYAANINYNSRFVEIRKINNTSLTPTPRAVSSRNAARVTVRNNTLTVRPSSPESVSRIRLIDMRGKSVASFTARGSANFSLGNIPAGRYFVEVREGARRERVSVVVGVR